MKSEDSTHGLPVSHNHVLNQLGYRERTKKATFHYIERKPNKNGIERDGLVYLGRIQMN